MTFEAQATENKPNNFSLGSKRSNGFLAIADGVNAFLRQKFAAVQKFAALQ